jgi:hypothetical protein
MTFLQKCIAGGIAAVLFILVVALAWRSEMERVADQATLQTTIKTLGDKIDQRNKQAQADTSAVDQQVAAAKTPDQQAALIAALVGFKQKPIIVTVPVAAPILGHAMPPAAGVGPLPDAPVPQTEASGDMIIPKADIPQFVSFSAGCKKDGIDLASCTANLTDVTTERNQAVNAANGGSWWERVKRSSKWLAIGAGIGAAFGYAAHR